jgi:type VI secretion system secreted protein Hcp
MSFDCFLQIKGSNAPTGESTDSTYPKWIALDSFSFGASNPSTIGPGAPGSGGGRVSVSSFNVMKPYDNSSPDLFLGCCLGNHFESATVVLRKAGGGQNVFLQYDFKEVYIDSVQQSGSSGGGDRPTESVSFSFEQVQVTYTPQTSTGAKGTPNVKGWNLTTDQKV